MEKFKKVENQCKLLGCRNPASSNGYCFRHMHMAGNPTKTSKVDPPVVENSPADLEEPAKKLVKVLTSKKKKKKNDKE